MESVTCWLEVHTTDAKKTQSFYSNLLGWKEGPGDVGFPYHFLQTKTGEQNFGGIMPHAPDSNVPAHWMPYFPVDDLSAAVKQVEQLGGSVRVPQVKLPQGQFAVVVDPLGAVFALFQF
jgi:uncharacterized protein